MTAGVMRIQAVSDWMATAKANSYVEAPIILDIEASGFGPGSYPIEVGVAMPDGTLHFWLIKPLSHWLHWQADAERIHGISRQQIEQEGQPIEEVAQALNELLVGKTVYSDGWGVDRTWLALLFHEAGWFQKFKLDSIYTLLNEQQLENWENNRQAVLESTGMVPHRAGTDALIIQKTYLYSKT